jgi:hypothetical protein
MNLPQITQISQISQISLKVRVGWFLTFTFKLCNQCHLEDGLATDCTNFAEGKTLLVYELRF